MNIEIDGGSLERIPPVNKYEDYKLELERARKTKGMKNIEEYPNHQDNLKKGKYKVEKLSFDQEIDRQFNLAKDERPTALRSNIVEKYVREILNKKSNPT